MVRLAHCLLTAALLIGTVSAVAGCGSSTAGDAPQVQLLNVSYDPTRELWRDVNARFIEDYRTKTGTEVAILIQAQCAKAKATITL